MTKAIKTIKKASLSKPELISHGCVSCVWKQHGMCPHNLTGDQVYDNGICPEFNNFLMDIYEQEGSKSKLWEKFHIYVLQLQEREDAKEYMQLKEDIRRLKSEGGRDKEALKELEFKENTLRLWNFKFNELILKSLGKVNDRDTKRESKVDVNVNVFNPQNFNKLINQAQDFIDAEYKEIKDDKKEV